MRRTPVALGILSIAVAVAATAGVSAVQPRNITLRPDLVVSGFGFSPVEVPRQCVAGQTVIPVRLIVTNRGPVPSAAIKDQHAVWVEDSVNTAWAAGASLPAIPAGGRVSVTITMPTLKDPAQMAGHRIFNAIVDPMRAISESSYENNTTPLMAAFPPGFCGPPASPVIAPRPVLVALPAPSNLTNTVTQAVCSKYGGSAAALACSIGLPAGKLVLVWDYPANVAVDGYHVYVKGSSQPLATQSVPGVRLEVLDPPKPGTCFDVTAFRGKDESPHSPTQYCVTK